MKKLCLVAIVKNEAPVIERMLESVKDIIDCYSIVDTGSSDGTPEIIKKYFAAAGISGNVHHSAWKNFGANRSESFELAKDMAEYSLLMDADWKIVNNGFSGELTGDAYSIELTSGDCRYRNTGIIKNSLPWKCVGAIHEYWTSPESKETLYLESLSILNLADGADKHVRFERNLNLLLQGVEDEPENARYMYYLASTYRDLKKYSEAIHWFNKRIEAGGYEEEVWHSIYQKGLCKIWRGDDTMSVVETMLSAIDNRKWRMEPLYHLMRFLREKKYFTTAYVLGRMLWSQQYPTYDVLFVEKDVYDWRFSDEFSLSAYYSGHKEEFRYHTKLALEGNIPDEHKERLINNLTY